jgi:hypothetical protein
MKIELQNKLIEKYPKIFKDMNKSPQESLMCFGFECGDGWYWLIDKLCEFFVKIYRQTGANVIAVQVKEKYGELRFYFYIAEASEETAMRIYNMVRFFETLSIQTCEVCGEMGVLYTSGWYKTLCAKHKNSRRY